MFWKTLECRTQNDDLLLQDIRPKGACAFVAMVSAASIFFSGGGQDFTWIFWTTGLLCLHVNSLLQVRKQLKAPLTPSLEGGFAMAKILIGLLKSNPVKLTKLGYLSSLMVC